MEFSIKTGLVTKQQAPAAIVGVFSGSRLTGHAQVLDKHLSGAIKNIIKQGDLGTETGQVYCLSTGDSSLARIILVNCGKKEDFNLQAYNRVTRAALKVVRTLPIKQIINTLPDCGGGDLKLLLHRAQYIASTEFYQFTDFKSKKVEPLALKKMFFLAADANQAKSMRKLTAQGSALDKAMKLTKDLGNYPGNVCTPTYLAQQARKLAKEYSKVKTTVMEEAAMKKLGMNCLLSVSKGSVEPPKTIILEYKGKVKKGAKPIVLVGKGVTFDTGGISIKPSLKMEEMKFDMCGAGSVLGMVKAVAELELPIHLIGVIGAVENMPSHKASKPGDIVTTLSGQTVEIINTDAEGRLVLCDLLTYVRRYNPEVVIDIATLTGAMVISLGGQASGVFTHDDKLAQAFSDASDTTGDRSWRLPIWPEYFESLRSNYADMMNCGSREAGSITAAMYLSRFTEGMRWLHLDIANIAWHNEGNKGASGRPLPMLLEFLCQQ